MFIFFSLTKRAPKPVERSMDTRAMSKSEKSLCEKSMKVVTNIIRLSSFSIALKTVGTTSGKTTRRLSTSSGSESEYADMVPEKEQYESKWSKAPKSRANPTYVTYPVLSDESTSHHFQEQQKESMTKQKKEESVNLLAAKYIEKMRKRLGYGSQKA